MTSAVGRAIRRWIGSFFVSQGLTLFDKDQLEYAKAELQRALRIAPNHPEAHYHLGRIYARQGRYAEAVEELSHAIAAKPRLAKAFTLRGLNRIETGDIEGAIADGRQAVALKRSYEHLSDLGAVYTAAGRFAEAQQALQEALALKPKEAAGHLRLGECYLAQKQDEAARQVLEKAAELDPKNAAAVAALARAHENLGDLREALKQYTRAGFLDRKNADYRCDAARVTDAQGDAAGALISYQEALRIDPECAEALSRLSETARLEGDLEKARGYAERLARAHAERWQGHYQLALAFAELGEEKPSLEELKRALECDHDAVVAASAAADFSGLKSGYKFKNLLAG